MGCSKGGKEDVVKIMAKNIITQFRCSKLLVSDYECYFINIIIVKLTCILKLILDFWLPTIFKQMNKHN